MDALHELPFSARYSLPAQVSENLGEVSWETVVQLSTDFQLKTADKSSKVKKVIKELQMSRLLLMDRINRGTKDGKIDPQLLVDIVRLLQRSEEIASEYEIDLHEFSSFLYLISEKLKKEKLALHIPKSFPLSRRLARARNSGNTAPLGEELLSFKDKGERPQKKKKVK